MFTPSRHLFLSLASLSKSTTSHHISFTAILILYSHLRLGLRSGNLPLGFPIATPSVLLFSPPTHSGALHPNRDADVTVLLHVQPTKQTISRKRVLIPYGAKLLTTDITHEKGKGKQR